MFNLARYTKEYLVTSPHTTIVSKEKVMGEYYRDTTQDMAFQDTIYSISIVDVETFEEELEDSIEGTIILSYIEEILNTWEAYHADMRTIEQWERELAEGLIVRDIVPKEYHEYLHIFEAKDSLGLPPH
jgi:hypothetical protein